MRVSSIAWGMVFVFLSGTAMAADRPVIGPEPGWVRPAGERAAPPATNAPVLVMLNDQQVRLQADGYESYAESRVRIQTPQGLGALGTLSLAWRPDKDTITVHRVVVKRNGEVRDLLQGAEPFTILRREDMLEQAILTGTLTAVLQPPDLQVNDILEFAYTIKRTETVMPDLPSLMLAWPNAPVSHVRLRATWPAALAVRWQFRDFQPQLENIDADGVRGIAFTLDDPPPLVQPTGAPTHHIAVRRLELSAVQSWKQLSTRLAPLYTRASALDPESPLREEAKRIRASNSNPRTRAAAALRLVQEQVRYVLLAMNDGGLVPASADETWERRYGDCKAKTVLLLALLRELGIEATPVAVHTVMGRGVDKELPGIASFDHVLLRASIDGQTYWLDGTRPADRHLENLPTPLYGWGLPLDAKGSDLVRIEPEPLKQASLEREFHIDASTGFDQPARVRASALFRGDTALALKLAYDSLDDSRKERALKEYWRDELPTFDATTVASRFDEQAGEMLLTGEGTFDMEWDDDWYELPYMRPGYRADFARPAGSNEQAPYAVSFPEYVIDRQTVKLPADGGPYSLSGTARIARTVARTEYKRSASLDKLELKAESSFRTLAPEFPAAESRQAQTALRELNREGLFIGRPEQMPSAEALRSQAGQPLDTAGQYVKRGLDMISRDLFELSIAEFDAAIELGGADASAYAGRGQARFSLRQYEEARADFNKALVADPKNVNALRSLGWLAILDDNSKEALDFLSRALEIEDHAWARRSRATLYLQQKQLELSLSDWEALCASDEAEPEDFTSRASLLIQLQRKEEVAAVAEEARKRSFGEVHGTMVAADILDMIGDREGARAVLEQTTEPLTAAALVQRASRHADASAIEADLQRALQVDPHYLRALEALASLYLTTYKAERALALLDTAAAEGVQGFTISHLRGEALVRLGRKGDAITALARARELARAAVEFNALCWTSGMHNFELEQGLKDCDAALDKLPDCAPCHDSRGLVLLRMGRLAQSIAAYDAALKRNPRLGHSLFGRGVARQKSGDVEGGAADIKEAMRLSGGILMTYSEMGIEPVEL